MPKKCSDIYLNVGTFSHELIPCQLEILFQKVGED